MLITKFGSRGATPQSVLEKYDAAHARIVTCLESVRDDEWHKGVKPLGAFGAYKTVESSAAQRSSFVRTRMLSWMPYDAVNCLAYRDRWYTRAPATSASTY